MRQKKQLLWLCLIFVTLFSLSAFANGENWVRIGSDLHIFEDQQVHGNSVTIFGDQQIDGDVDGSAVTIFGDIELKGEVDEELVTLFGKVTLHDGAKVRGDLVNVMGTIKQSENSSVYGEVIDVGPSLMLGNIFKMPFRFRGFNFMWWPSMRWSSIFFSILITLIVIHFFFVNLENINKVVLADPLRMGVKGLLGTIVAVLVMILFGITILGIPVAIILGVILWAANTFGIVAIYFLIGERLAEQMQWDVTHYVKGIIGAVVIGVVALIPMGGFVKMIAGWVGLGAVIQTKFGTGKPWIR
ncbi:MAG: hypothetical protein KAX49_12245 [Halanaerobiales bacterium]|nr:hypothetical protein [Halanaerobiales bacterium]